LAHCVPSTSHSLRERYARAEDLLRTRIHRQKKQTRRDRFLADLEQLVSWAQLEAQVAPFYSDTTGKRGRPAIGLSRMLRMYVVQQCFGFSDEGCEDAVYDSQAIRSFMGIDLGRESAPDATTLLRFRRLLETHQLTRVLFETITCIWPAGVCCSRKALSSTLP